MSSVNFKSSNINDGKVLVFIDEGDFIWGNSYIPTYDSLKKIIDNMNDNLRIDIIEMFGKTNVSYDIAELFKIDIQNGYYEGLAISLNYKGTNIETLLKNDGYDVDSSISNIQMSKDLGFNLKETNGRIDINNTKMLEYICGEEIKESFLEKYNIDYLNDDDFADFIDKYTKYYNIQKNVPNLNTFIVDTLDRLSSSEYENLICNVLYKDEFEKSKNDVLKLKSILNKYEYLTEKIAYNLDGVKQKPGFVNITETINLTPNKEYDKEFMEYYEDDLNYVDFNFNTHKSFSVDDLIIELDTFIQDLNNIEKYIKSGETLRLHTINIGIRELDNAINIMKKNMSKNINIEDIKDVLFLEYFNDVIVNNLYLFRDNDLSDDNMQMIKDVININNYKDVLNNVKDLINDDGYHI